MRPSILILPNGLRWFWFFDKLIEPDIADKERRPCAREPINK
jgi:hypothetical protein